jgi:rhodanese-related sulfurtransferase
VSMFHGHKVPEVSAVDAESGQTSHVLLDVRNADEWEAGHAPSAQWVPLRDLEGVRFQLPMNRRIVCVCRTGARSERAAESLISWGFEAANMVGGMKDWAASGLPVVRDDGSPGTVI